MDHFYYSVLEKIEQVFIPDSAELQRIQERLHRFSKQELRNLDKNFHTFGVEEVLKCMVETGGNIYGNDKNDA